MRSATLKEAVATPAEPVKAKRPAKEVVVKTPEAIAEPVAAAPTPAKRGPKPKDLPAPDLKAAKKELAVLQKQAQTSEKAHLAELAVLQKQLTAGLKEVEKPLDEAKAAVTAAKKLVEKAELKVGSTITRVNKDIEKLNSAHGKARDKLIQAKAKADAVLAKQIAKLLTIVGE